LKEVVIMQFSRLLLVSILIIVGVSLPSHSSLYYVCPEGDNSNNGRTPQTAWRNVSYATQQVGNDPSDPDTVFIFPGLYDPAAGETFPVVVNSYTALIGTDTSVVLQANSNSLPVIEILNEFAFWLENLEIREGAVGISASECSHFCICNSNVHHNLDRGVKIQDSKRFAIRENSITYNTGGGLEIDQGKGVVILGNTFMFNLIERWGSGYEIVGGGISILNSERVKIKENVVSANKLLWHVGYQSFSGQGGGICIVSSYDITLRNNTIEGNEINAFGYNSITFEKRGLLELVGGGISIFDSEVVRITGNVASANRLSSDGGGSVYGRGGGIRIRSSYNITLLGNAIEGNVVNIDGGWFSTSFSYGGGVYVSDCQDIQLQNNLIAGNRLYASADELALSDGGGIHVLYSSVIIRRNRVEGNTTSVSGDSDEGGGAGIFFSYGVEALLQKNIITNNSCERSGGGICVLRYGEFVIGGEPGDGNDIYGNQAGGVGDDLCYFGVLDTLTATFNYFNGPPEPAKIYPPERWNTCFWRDNSILQNEPPHILSFSPTCAETTLYFGDSLLFWIESLDYDGDSTLTWWLLNRQPVAQGDSFLFIAEPQHVGYDTVQVNVTDRRSVTSHQWYMEVIGERVDTFVKLASLPMSFALNGNYPNPFNLSTVIQYQLPVDCHVRLEVYDILGRKVATLAEGEQEAGYRSFTWDASELSSGIYMYKLTAGDFTRVKKMMLVK
jgi:hypothetical protein